MIASLYLDTNPSKYSSMEPILPRPVVDMHFKDRKLGTLGWVLLAAVLLAQAQSASTPVLRSFDRVLLLEEKGETSAGVSLGDLNGDGLPDIVLGKGRHWPLFNRVLLNDGHGGFIASNLGSAPDRTYSAALADVDGDGHPDIVVSNDAPDRKLVYRNDGSGHFTEFGTFGDPSWSTRYVTLADLNDDGFPDIVAANRGDYPDPVDGKPGKGPQHPTLSYVCFNDGKEGMAFVNNRWENRCSDLSYTLAGNGSFVSGIELNRIAAIVDLGSPSDLRGRYGYDDAENGGVGFASLRLEGDKVMILHDDNNPAKLTWQPVQEAARLAEVKSSATAPIQLGHIYLLRIADSKDKTSQHIVKLMVIAYRPEEAVTVRWELL